MTTTEMHLHAAAGAVGDPAVERWTSDDCLLYALGVGGGLDELAYTTENTAGVQQVALPTLPVVVGQRAKVFHLLGKLDWTKIVHAEQSVELLAPVPVAGEIETVGRIADVFDKGKAAAAVIEFSSRDCATGAECFRTTMTLMIRGEGGWGGDPGPSSTWGAPDRDPDHVVVEQTSPTQALLYRLTGDRNRLHSDPAFAAKAGFRAPILHGLCTFGYAGRALLRSACAGDASRFKRMSARFSSPVFPGDTLRTEVWDGDGHALFRTVGPDETVVLTNGRLELA